MRMFDILFGIFMFYTAMNKKWLSKPFFEKNWLICRISISSKYSSKYSSSKVVYGLICKTFSHKLTWTYRFGIKFQIVCNFETKGQLDRKRHPPWKHLRTSRLSGLVAWWKFSPRNNFDHFPQQKNDQGCWSYDRGIISGISCYRRFPRHVIVFTGGAVEIKLDIKILNRILMILVQMRA